MILLGIETATSACAAGLAGPGWLDVRVLDTQRRHGEHLMAGISTMLAEHGLVAREVQRVVVDRGPGLFTGLRVGVASAMAFAQAAGAELVSISSLEMLAHDAYARGRRGRLVAVLDARRHEVFTQAFELADSVVALEAARVQSPEALARELALSPSVIIGDGALRYADQLGGALQIDEVLVPDLRAGLALAETRPSEVHVSPLYLRDADAVANFSTRDAGR